MTREIVLIGDTKRRNPEKYTLPQATARSYLFCARLLLLSCFVATQVERLLEASQRDAAARDTDADVLSGALAEQQAKLSALERRESSLRRELTALVRRLLCAEMCHAGSP